ncbi:hypothetical protein D037_0683B, partial [Vibrio parahaemolyticus IDH02640]
ATMKQGNLMHSP